MMTALIVPLVYSLLLPLGLLLWWKNKSAAKLSAFLVGAFCFSLFAMVLESALHSVVLTTNPDILAKPLLYMLYAAFAAGIFEETGRYFGFRVLLKKQRSASVSVAYGIGHGGIEVLLTLGSNYLLLLLCKSGVSVADEATMATLMASADAITLPLALVAMLERLSAVMAHIGLSMLVFTAVWQKGKKGRYPSAILLHALLDIPAALYQLGVLRSVFVVELLALVLGVVYLWLGIKAYRGYDEPNEEEICPTT